MQLYDSLSKSLQKFKPVEDGKVIIYVCGLTPYDRAHIGHARTYVAFDIIKRWLKKQNKIYHIQNITDVDDKIIKRCKETGADPLTLTAENHREALDLFDRLNILRADIYPKVTEHIEDIISIINQIIENGLAYETATGVYFDISKFTEYGKLSGQKMGEIKAGSRKEVDETKDDPADFALWKKTTGEIIEFDSPWGRGRPGWHIECSAMSKKYAKRTIDIHGGGLDLIFPHHENEIAQSEASDGKKFVKYWMHTGPLTVNGEKMSKSLGNFVTLEDAMNKYEPNSIRMFFALTHYRSPMDYNEEQIEAAGESVERIFNAIGLIWEALETKEKKNEMKTDFVDDTNRLMKEMDDAMENDFDTPKAAAALFNLIRATNAQINEKTVDYQQLIEIHKKITEFVWTLGLTERKIDLENKKTSVEKIMLDITGELIGSTAEMLDKLVQLRDKFRKEKNYQMSDKIRNELNSIGITLEDDKGKTKWKVK